MSIFKFDSELTQRIETVKDGIISNDFVVQIVICRCWGKKIVTQHDKNIDQIDDRLRERENVNLMTQKVGLVVG